MTEVCMCKHCAELEERDVEREGEIERLKHELEKFKVALRPLKEELCAEVVDDPEELWPDIVEMLQDMDLR